MAFYKKLTAGVACAMTIGAPAGHGETFREALDEYFAKHSQDFQKSIREWDDYNQHAPEYLITEQELKDVVLKSYAETIRYLCLSLEHQIRFFWDYAQHMYAYGKTADPKKVFNGKQILGYALRELDDVMKQFELRKISYPRLTEYQKEFGSHVTALKDSVAFERWFTFSIDRDSDDVIAGGHKYYERTVNDIYAIERVNEMFASVFNSESGLYRGFHSTDIARLFVRGFCRYTKWNPKAYPGWEKREYPIARLNEHDWRLMAQPPRAQWEMNSRILQRDPDSVLIVKSYPKYCLNILSEQWEDIEELLLQEDLVQTYLNVIGRLKECIEVACSLCKTYAEKKFLAKQEKEKKTTTFIWEDWHLKRAALLMAWETDFRSIMDLMCKHKEFGKIADELTKIYSFLDALHPDWRPEQEKAHPVAP